MHPCTYSFVLPAYNEQERIGASLEKILAYIGQRHWNAEVLVVDDGSQDATAEVISCYSRQNPAVRLLTNPTNRGKGYSVRQGMLHATGDVILFTDADLSTPISEAEKLFSAIAAGADVVIGSRWLNKNLQTLRQPVYRQLVGRLFNFVLWFVLRLNYHDTQCGFKAFSRHAAQTLFSLQQIERWGFDAEILFLARKTGMRISEVPVAWAHDHRSKIVGSPGTELEFAL